jgi:hypothetical protein
VAGYVFFSSSSGRHYVSESHRWKSPLTVC